MLKIKFILCCAAVFLIAGLMHIEASAEYLKHPVEVVKAVCSECHPDKWHDMDHDAGWYKIHRFRSVQRESVCGACHKESFCADCHADKEEIKPSDKYKDSPLREMPHRGDYLTQHKIDGKINPASCFRCHGRGNNRKCGLCHK
jgi:hypothetical protein